MTDNPWKREAVEKAGKAIHAALEKLSEDERPEAIRRAHELGGWCPLCGGNAPPRGSCQCWNDD